MHKSNLGSFLQCDLPNLPQESPNGSRVGPIDLHFKQALPGDAEGSEGPCSRKRAHSPDFGSSRKRPKVPSGSHSGSGRSSSTCQQRPAMPSFSLDRQASFLLGLLPVSYCRGLQTLFSSCHLDFPEHAVGIFLQLHSPLLRPSYRTQYPVYPTIQVSS